MNLHHRRAAAEFFKIRARRRPIWRLILYVALCVGISTGNGGCRNEELGVVGCCRDAGFGPAGVGAKCSGREPRATTLQTVPRIPLDRAVRQVRRKETERNLMRMRSCS